MHTCTSCGEKHEDMPAIGFAIPDPYNQLSEEERIAYQAECDSDFCIIRYPDQTDRFIRAVLLIPIIGHLHCNVVTQSDNRRPLLQLHQGSEHPLVRDFYHGIEYAEAQARIDAVFGADY